MLFWEQIIREERARSDQLLLERCRTRLLDEDPELRAFEAMAPAQQEREKFFMSNSIRGYLGFLEQGDR